MVRKVTASTAKAQLLSLLDEASAGEEIEITKHGRPVARLVPARGAHALRGVLAGVAASAGSDEELFTTGVDWNVG
jgi:prevent-host-death family protein